MQPFEKGADKVHKWVTDLKDVIAGCKKGESRAQHALFKLTGPKMLGLCRRYCQTEDDAHDALQEGYVKVFTSIEKYRGESSIETWMGRIFINTAIDLYKKGAKYGKMFGSLPEQYDAETEVYQDNPFPCSADEVLSVMDEMPEGYRIIFNLYCIENYTHKQIADLMGISEGTSKSQYARAKKYIYEALVKKGKIVG